MISTLDWYLGTAEVGNGTGSWYFGVTYIDIPENDNLTNHITDMENCENSGIMDLTLDDTFGDPNPTKSYKFRIYLNWSFWSMH